MTKPRSDLISDHQWRVERKKRNYCLRFHEPSDWKFEGKRSRWRSWLQGSENQSTFERLLLNISFHTFISRLFKALLTPFFFLTSFCPFDVFENFSSSFLLFFGFIFWTGQIGDFLLPSFPLTKIIIIKLYVEFDTKYGKFLWMNKLTFRSNNISQNFVLLTLHEKLTFNTFVFVKNYLCTR